MDFLKLAQDRYSVRKFSDQPVTQEELDQVVKAGMLAPTGMNLQPQRILVIQKEETMSKLRECTKCHFGAPVAMIVCYDKNDCWVRQHYDQKTTGEMDISIVVTHMQLQLASMGMGSTFIMHFNPEKVKDLFQIPENYQLCSLLVLGHPAEDATPINLHSECDDVKNLYFYEKF